MKKLVSLLCVLFLLSFAAGASAAVKTVYAQYPEEILRIVAGKTLPCAVHGFDFDGNTCSLYIYVFDRARFSAEDVKSLQPGDSLASGGWYIFGLKEIEPDEFGVKIVDESGSAFFLYPDEDGSYYLVDEIEHTLYLHMTSFYFLLADDFVYVDDSDPDLEAEPVTGTVEDVMKGCQEESSFFNEENTRITFNENGEITELRRIYTPWNER